MRRQHIALLITTVCLVALLTLTIGQVPAGRAVGKEKTTKKGKTTKAKAKPQQTVEAQHSATTNEQSYLTIVDDPAFDRFVDLELLGAAIWDLDAAALADAGLQLAEGERVLHRSHKAGITARHVLKKAALLAAKKNDKATLQRLNRAAKRMGDEVLVSHVKNVCKAAESSRNSNPLLNVSVGEMTTERFAIVKAIHECILRAELLGHDGRLKTLDGIVKDANQLPKGQKAVIRKLIDKTQQGIVKKLTATDRILTQLSASSRGFDPFRHSGLEGGGWLHPSIPHGYTGYKTNKFDLMNNVASGGWKVAWADDVTETDAAKGVVAAGVSVYLENPGPFLEWVRSLVRRTIDSLRDDAKRQFPAYMENQLKSLAADAIRSAIQGRSANEVLRRYDTFDFKAGAIRYSGGNYLEGQLITPTFGIKPYIAIRWRGSTGGNTGGGGSGHAGRVQRIFARNNARFPIYVAVHYYRGSVWHTQGFSILQPGERRHICDSNGRWIYFYANGPHRRVLWSGRDVYETVHGERYAFRKVDTGTSWSDFTYNFNYTPPVPPPSGGNLVLSRTGRLTAGDHRYRTGKYYDTFRVYLHGGSRYRIDLTSSSLDTFLYVKTDQWQEIAHNDDGGSGRNSRIVFRAPRTGYYRLVATTFGPRQTGIYSLVVRTE